jgi:hypothetical protein
MKRQASERLEKFLQTTFFQQARHLRACAAKEASMEKTNTPFRGFSAHDARPGHTFAKACSEAALYLKDRKVAQLLLLLRQLNETTGGLVALPKAELREVVSSAVGVSGFVNPLEVQEVIAAVLEAFEVEEPYPILRGLPVPAPPE